MVRSRCLQGHLMDGAVIGRGTQTHYNKAVLTDMTLSLLQDTGWCACN